MLSIFSVHSDYRMNDPTRRLGGNVSP